MDEMRAVLPDVTVARAILLCAAVTAAILVKRREGTSPLPERDDPEGDRINGDADAN